MAAIQLMRALDALNAAIAQSRIESLLAPLTLYSTAPRPSTEAVLQCFAALSSSQERFGASEETVISALDLQPLFASAWWAELINALTQSRLPESLAQEMTELGARLRLLKQNLPKLSSLLRPAAFGEAGDGRQLILTMPALDGVPAGLGRISAAVDGIGHLASALADLHGSPAPLRLAGIETEPAISLLFDGDLQPLQALKRLLASIGEQLTAHQDMAPANRVTVIAPTLPIMDEIRGHADAVRLRALIETGVRRLLEAEFMLPVPPTPGVTSSAAAIPRRLSSPPGTIDLIEVIAEERRQLGRPAQRRAWGNAARVAQSKQG